MVAARADAEIIRPFLDEDHLLALAALVPQMVRGIALRGERQGVADAVEPAHAAVSFAPWIASARVRVQASSAAAAASPCAEVISPSADPPPTPSATQATSAARAGLGNT